MANELYEKIRTKLYGGHEKNPLAPLTQNPKGITEPILVTPEQFSQILFELTDGDLNRSIEKVAYKVISKGMKNLLMFPDGGIIKLMKVKGKMEKELIRIDPYKIIDGESFYLHDMKLKDLISNDKNRLGIIDTYNRVSLEYKKELSRIKLAKAAAESKITEESKLETAIKIIEKAENGATISIRGKANMEGLLNHGFQPHLVENPHDWVDREDFPGMYYRHEKSGIELILTVNEKFQPVEELSHVVFELSVVKSYEDDKPNPDFPEIKSKLMDTKKDGSTYTREDLIKDIIALVRYPDELKDRTENDLSLVITDLNKDIESREELGRGELGEEKIPYDYLFNRQTPRIINHVLKNRPVAKKEQEQYFTDLRKRIDYFENTGIIDKKYKKELTAELKPLEPTSEDKTQQKLILNYKRVKEISLMVFNNLPSGKLDPKLVTKALAPFYRELGLVKLVEIRNRIVNYKEMKHDSEQNT